MDHESTSRVLGKPPGRRWAVVGGERSTIALALCFGSVATRFAPNEDLTRPTSLIYLTGLAVVDYLFALRTTRLLSRKQGDDAVLFRDRRLLLPVGRSPTAS